MVSPDPPTPPPGGDIVEISGIVERVEEYYTVGIQQLDIPTIILMVMAMKVGVVNLTLRMVDHHQD